VKLLLDDGSEHISGRHTPDFRLHRVLARAHKPLDAQVLLDPLEEQLKLLAILVQGGNGQRRQACVVAQEYQCLTGSKIFETDTAQVREIVLGDIRDCVQHIDTGIQIDIQHVIGVETPGTLNQAYRQGVIGVPTPKVQRVAKRRALRHPLHSHAKQLGLVGTKADLDIGQEFAPSQLRKRHHAKRIGATQSGYTGIAAMTIDDSTECLPSHVPHDLCKKCLAQVHALPQAVQTR
jgi:hypothetical protein